MQLHDAKLAEISRRTFLKTVGWIWAIPVWMMLRQIAQFIGQSLPVPSPMVFALGMPQSLPSLPAHIERARIFLQKDDEGYYALDNVCTHLGCLIHPQPDGTFACPCHGSRYTADGQVIRGPAVRPLPYLELHWDNVGQLAVDRSKKVAATFRLPATNA
ncbi:MAG: ubiquinol-cytochrome c reductase iron-sulfur subunit [Lysobacteraceae bacterium]|nr:MAG: ubiquinol-cytochrome c reductase iron-sulfur subunit [Xanthomonadaceae bacterium]